MNESKIKKLNSISLIVAGLIVIGIIICDLYKIEINKTLRIIFLVFDVLILAILIYTTVRLQKDGKK